MCFVVISLRGSDDDNDDNDDIAEENVSNLTGVFQEMAMSYPFIQKLPDYSRRLLLFFHFLPALSPPSSEYKRNVCINRHIIGSILYRYARLKNHFGKLSATRKRKKIQIVLEKQQPD